MQGTVATTVCSPADVLKVRYVASFLFVDLDSDVCTESHHERLGQRIKGACFVAHVPRQPNVVLQSTIELIRRSMRNEGPMFMLKGCVPAWMRLQPTTMLIFITFEQLKNLVDWTRALREQD